MPGKELTSAKQMIRKILVPLLASRIRDTCGHFQELPNDANIHFKIGGAKESNIVNERSN